MVGRSCCVINCYSKSHSHLGQKIDNGIRFFSFPTCKQREGKHIEELTRRRRMEWISAVRRKDISFNNIPVSLRVCSLHFQSGQPAYEMHETHPDWTPSLLLGHTEMKPTDRKRYSRQLSRRESQRAKQDVTDSKRARLDVEDSEMAQQENAMAQNSQDDSVQECMLCQSTCKEMNRLLDENKCLKEEVNKSNMLCQSTCKEMNRLLDENKCLKEEVNKSRITEDLLKNNNVKVKYYTGLPSYAILQVLLCHITPFLPQERKLTPFQMILITFMRLRLDLPIQHIAHIFSVHRVTVSAAFKDTVNILYTRFTPLVHWPDRQSLQVSMPHQFVEAFGNRVAAIVDCFELIIERPSNLHARAQTFSHYKHSHTLKYLISITPQGSISFVSKGWGGCTSDKRITENCGFLDKLLPGDIVLADRGFDIKESVGLMCAEVKIPAFTKGKHQLEAKDVEETRRIAHLRILVERIIGVVRNKYKILSSTVPINMVLPCDGENVTFVEKIVTVCCALTNMCPSVVL